MGVDLIIKSCFTGAPRGHGDREDKFGTEVCQGAIFGVPGTFTMCLINNMDTHMMMLKTSHRLLKKRKTFRGFLIDARIKISWIVIMFFFYHSSIFFFNFIHSNQVNLLLELMVFWLASRDIKGKYDA